MAVQGKSAAYGLRQQQRDETRAVILDAAIDCFAGLGFDGTNFREITARCGVDRSLVLYHFQSKHNLWIEAAREIERRFTEHFDAHYQPDVEAQDREILRYTLDRYLDSLIAVPYYAQILLREGCAGGERMEWLAENFAPRSALNPPIRDKGVLQRLQKSVLRDILASAIVSFIALGPLLEKSLAVASRQKSAGVFPLTKNARKEFIDCMLLLIFGQ